MPKRLSCCECGICCVSAVDGQAYWADVDERDLKRLGKSYVQRNVQHAGIWFFDNTMAIRTRKRQMRAGPLKGWMANVCVSLRGSVLNQVSCAVYDRRPDTCRKFRAGSKKCRELQKEYLEFAEIR